MPGKCHRCKDPVFAAEEKRAMNHIWHANCFSCASCGQILDSISLAENRAADDIYCGACYKRLFATISYGLNRPSFAAARANCNCCTEYNHLRSPSHLQQCYCPCPTNGTNSLDVGLKFSHHHYQNY